MFLLASETSQPDVSWLSIWAAQILTPGEAPKGSQAGVKHFLVDTPYLQQFISYLDLA